MKRGRVIWDRRCVHFNGRTTRHLFYLRHYQRVYIHEIVLLVYYIGQVTNLKRKIIQCQFLDAKTAFSHVTPLKKSSHITPLI